MDERFNWKLTPNTNSSYIPFFPAFSIQAELDKTYSQLFFWVEAIFEEALYTSGVTALCRSGIQTPIYLGNESINVDIYSLIHFPSSGMLKPTITTGVYSSGDLYTEVTSNGITYIGTNPYTSDNDLTNVTFVLHGGRK